MKRLVTLLVVLMTTLVYGQDAAERINFAHHYNLEEALRINYRTGVDEFGRFSAIIELEANSAVTAGDYLFSFKSLPDYTASTEVPEVPPIQNALIGQNEKTLIYKFQFPQLTEGSLLLCQILHQPSGIAYFADIQVSERALHVPLIDPTGLPVLNSFVTEGRYKIGQSIDFDVYSYDFPAARPPMSTSPPDVSKTMEVVSSFNMDSTYDHIFDEKGLHVGRNANNKIAAVYRVQGAYFPEYVTVPDLVEPLVYITTKGERDQLEKNFEDKKVFDRFWLDLTGSKERARWIIKNYYRRITEANLLFTSFKEGWKTDRGMMYVIFGAPDEVIRNGNEEVWYYTKGPDNDKLLFSFSMIRSPYAERQYVLKRDPNLSDPWMKAVKYWRQGMPINDM